MGGYNKFNVVFYINGVEFIDCRAFYKVADCVYRRIGADEYNNVETLLDASSVEGYALREGIEYDDLITEEEMNNELIGGLRCQS